MGELATTTVAFDSVGVSVAFLVLPTSTHVCYHNSVKTRKTFSIDSGKEWILIRSVASQSFPLSAGKF